MESEGLCFVFCVLWSLWIEKIREISNPVRANSGKDIDREVFA